MLHDEIRELRDRMARDMGETNVTYVEAPDAVHDYCSLDWHEPGVVIVLGSEIYVALVIVVFLSFRLLWSAEHDNADGDIASDGVTLQRAERRVKVRTRSHEDPIVVLTCR